MTEALAHHVGVHPASALNARTMPENSDAELGRLLYDGPLLPFHYRLEGFKAKPDVARAAIMECAQRYPVP